MYFVEAQLHCIVKNISMEPGWVLSGPQHQPEEAPQTLFETHHLCSSSQAQAAWRQLEAAR